MTRARDVANVLSTATSLATDTETAAAISSHNTAANGHIGRGNTASRPASPTVGDTYFDTTLDALISYKSTTVWEKVSQDPAPQIASISPSTAATTGTTVTITGASFKSGLSVQFIGTNAAVYNSPVATFVGATTATATTPALPVSYEPYDVKVINSDNQFAVLDNCLDSGGTPTWSTASGTLITINRQASLSTSVSSTDPDGTSIVYSSSNLPAWISLNSSTGALTGTSPTVSVDTTYSFDIAASDGVNSSSRSFNVVVTSTVITGGNEIKSVGSYKYHFFTTDGTLAVSGASKNIEVCSIGGGGAGGAKGHAGGGGAGELDIWTPVNSATGNYAVVIGLGGTGTSNQTVPGNNGGTTTFGSVVTSLGGGGGGSRQQNAPTAGASGGSGGGGNTYSDNTANGGAASGSNTFAGGRGGTYTDPYYSSGGGGGATAAGGNASTGSTVVGGAGGQGYTLTTIDSNLTAANFTSLTGMTVICSGGGGSAYLANSGTSVSGGVGGTGAGNGGYSNSGGGYSGEPTNAVSYGSGGGGAQFNGTATASNGKSGLVIVRYLG